MNKFEPSKEEIKKIREETNISLHEAKQTLKRAKMDIAINEAKTIEDLKSILRELIWQLI